MKEILTLREHLRRLLCRVLRHKPPLIVPTNARMYFCKRCGQGVEIEGEA